MGRAVESDNSCDKYVPNHVTKFTPFQVETGFYGQNAFDRVEQNENLPADIRTMQQAALQRIDQEKVLKEMRIPTLNRSMLESWFLSKITKINGRASSGLFRSSK